MRIGTSVAIHSLVSRPTLNGRHGTIVKAMDAKTGRVGVKVEGEEKAVALKPSNLIDLVAEAMAAVFTNVDLLRIIWANVERWIRAGVLSGVCSLWHSEIWCHPDLYKAIVLVGSPGKLPRPPPQGKRARGFHRAKVYGARHFMEEGVLPMLPDGLGRTPDARWVEQLYVEPASEGDSRISEQQMEAILNMSFPSLTTLLLTCVDGYCNDAVDQWAATLPLGPAGMRSFISKKEERVNACREWIARHVNGPLMHLHLDQLNTIDLTAADGSVAHSIFDVKAQPGLVSMQLDGVWDIEAVMSWSDHQRRALTALEVLGYPSVDGLVRIVELLPHLRRLHFAWGGPQPDDFRRVAATRHPNLEAVYITMDSSEGLPDCALDVFKDLPALKELAVVCDSCKWIVGECADQDGLVSGPSTTEAGVTARLGNHARFSTPTQSPALNAAVAHACECDCVAPPCLRTSVARRGRFRVR
jgi:hypothetical protein